MNKIFLSKQFVNILMLFLLLIGVILRFYNLEFENLWFDEMASFYVSDPKISFLESYYRNNSVEGTPFLFNFLLSKALVVSVGILLRNSSFICVKKSHIV